MKIDFHIHTQASNGQFSSKQVIDQAIEKGLKAIAITDHDTILGLDSAFEYAKGKDINIIPGIELDTNNHIGHLHIIGLNINYKDKKFNEKLRLLRDDRNKRNLRFINEFNKIGVNISLEDVNKYVKGDIVSKYHFAQALKEKGYVHIIDEAYDKYFNQGELKKIKTKAFSPEESIKLIKKAGGTAILAHPQTLNLSARDLKAKVKE